MQIPNYYHYPCFSRLIVFMLNENENICVVGLTVELARRSYWGDLCYGSRTEKLTHHESRMLKSSSRVTRNMCVTDHEEYFFKSRFSVNKMISSRITKIPPHDPLVRLLDNNAQYCNVLSIIDHVTCSGNISCYSINRFIQAH